MKKKEILPQTEKYTKRNKQRSTWQKVVMVLGCIVVFCTTYALILPGITLEKSCDMEEHTHSEECYTQIVGPEVSALSCNVESLNLHVHTEACVDEADNAVCGIADYVVHEHIDSCYENGSLVCDIPELKLHIHEESCYVPHVHDDSCKAFQQGDLTCTLQENNHVHDDSCNGLGENYVCGKEETEGHSHSDACYTLQDVYSCGKEEAEGHAHTDDCYEVKDLYTCGKEEIRGHAHEDTCYTSVTTYGCGQEENADHTHDDACTPVQSTELSCGKDEIEGHAHDESCGHTREKNFICGKEEAKGHTHDDSCGPIQESVLSCGQDVVAAHTHTDACKEIVKVCGVEPHVHTDTCYSVVETESCGIEEGAPELICTEEEVKLHTHDAEVCYTYSEDTGGNEIATLVCTELELSEHIHSEDCFAMKLTDAALPLACALEESDKHTHGAECYSENPPLTCTEPEVKDHSHEDTCYKADGSLNCGMEEFISHTHGDECYDEEENLICTLEEAEGHCHTAICYGYWELTCTKTEHAHTADCDPLAGLSEADQMRVTRVIEGIDALPTADEIDAKTAEYEDAEDYAGEESYLTEVYTQVRNVYREYYALGETLQAYVTNADKLMELEYIWSAMNLHDVIQSATPTTVQAASTAEFIDLNLYDYNSNINSKYNSSTANPGFQWNGGAYMYSSTYDRHTVDFIDFGNSIITDGTYSGTNNGINSNRTIAGNQGGLINVLDISDYGTTNRPIGMSIGTDVLERALTPEGDIALAQNGSDLSYLFEPGTAVTKQNEESIDGLFQYNEATGSYWYNSRENHAQYDAGSNKFVLYNQIITPNFITYPFGNFLPFNDITDSAYATQVGAIGSGQLADYIWQLRERLDGSTAAEIQLEYMLEQYSTDLYNNGYWTGTNAWSAKDAIMDYLTGGGTGEGDDPTDTAAASALLTDEYLNTMYNIDYDVATNFWFAMTMEMDFYQPRDGLTGKDSNGDGKADYHMIFDFSGDDDVWVFVDGVLFLDLSGIHRHVGGKIDFYDGKVYYYALDTASTGDVNHGTAYATYTFEDLLTAGLKVQYPTYTDAQIQALVEEKLDPTTGAFKDYTLHNFQFYYIERGSGSSVCRMEFNFPLLERNDISVKKTLASDNSDIEALGNPDFLFQVNNVNDALFEQYTTDGVLSDEEEATVRTEEHYVRENWAYKLTDVDGTIIQDMVVTQTYQDGTVAELTVYKGPAEDGIVIRTEKTEKDIYNNYTTTVTDFDGNGNVVTGDNVLTLTADANGIFRIKAGQTAEFVGVSANWGRYYVRELIPAYLVDQYDDKTIKVNGESVGAKSNTVTIGGITYVAAESPIYDISTQHVELEITNQVATEKLGALELSKMVDNAGTDSEAMQKDFVMWVELDGVKLPVGTPYKLSYMTTEEGVETTVTETKTVTDAGKILLKHGQTARIENIVAGTTFKVYEDPDSADGYTVGYNITGGTADEVSVHTDYVTGKIKAKSETVAAAQLVVDNDAGGIDIEIPGIKSVYYATDEAERTYSFELIRVGDEKGGPITDDGPVQQENATATVKGGVVANFGFTITYTHTDVPTGVELPASVYYKITESSDTTGYTVIDPSIYIVEVIVSGDEETDGLKAEVKRILKYDDEKDTEATSVDTVAFVNNLTGDLTVTKQVIGGSSVVDHQMFNFELALKDETDKQIAVPTVISDSTGKTYTANDNGNFSFTLSHLQSVTFVDLPHGLTWTVTEVFGQPNENDGFLTENEVDGTKTDLDASGEALIASGQVVAGNTATKVTFSNEVRYELPNTGGTGIMKYTMGGLLLATAAFFALMYSNKRRREAF